MAKQTLRKRRAGKDKTGSQEGSDEGVDSGGQTFTRGELDG